MILHKENAVNLLIVTGLSGAGKTQALRHLEDNGYFCVDNLPCKMLEGFVQLCKNAKPPVEKAAVVIDSREQVLGSNIEQELLMLDRLPVSYRVLYLECRDEVLERRFNETRRSHPLSKDVRDGIAAERDILAGFREKADIIIDTTTLKPLQLAAKLSTLFAEKEDASFRLTVESFGYKRGVPYEADMVFDMRFLPNPFYEPELRSLSGADAPVQEFLLREKAYGDFLSRVESMLQMMIPCFIAQGKKRLLVAFGCTGGRHRSVSTAELLAKRMAGKYDVKLIHRDTFVEASDITERIGT